MNQLIESSLHSARGTLKTSEKKEWALRNPYCIFRIEKIQYGSKCDDGYND
jgi:hypothetical protein